MRGHAGQEVTDVQFFNQADVFCSVGSGPERSSLIVSRVSKQVGGDIVVDILIEFRTDLFKISRVVWHPFDMNVRIFYFVCIDAKYRCCCLCHGFLT